MGNKETMRLCGGTFLVLLLESRGYRRNARAGSGRASDGKSEPDVLAKLIQTTIPGFEKPISGRTFNTFTSDYKLCRKSDTPTVPLKDPRIVKKYDAEVNDNYSRKLSEFSAFLDTSIDIETNGRWLVAALLDLIEADESIPDNAEFFILPNGKSVNKDMLIAEENYCVPAFLMGVWHYILTHIPDNTVGSSTISLLLKSGSETHAERKFASDIGKKTVSRIQTYVSPPKYEACNSTLEIVGNFPESNVEIAPKRNPATNLKYFYKSSTFDTIEQMHLYEQNAVIDLNTAPHMFSLNKPKNTVYKYRTDCCFKSTIAPDRSRQVKVSINIAGTIFSGFTSVDNWLSRSIMNNFVFAGTNKYIVWFQLVSANVIQILMIGDTYDEQ